MNITIPPTLDDATARLSGIESLLTATEWEKAAILAAYVTLPGPGFRSDLATSSEVKSPQGFADLGIAGLRSKDTVRRYVEAWVEHSGQPAPRPGEKVSLPTVAWEDAVPARKTKAVDILQQPGAVAAALEDPEFAAKVVKRATPAARNSVTDAVFEQDLADDPTMARVEEAGRVARAKSDAHRDFYGDSEATRDHAVILEATRRLYANGYAHMVMSTIDAMRDLAGKVEAR